MSTSIQKDPRINTAITPSEKLEADCYDWYERHQAVLAIKDRLNPDVVLIGDDITSDFCHPNETGYAIWGHRQNPILDKLRKPSLSPYPSEATAKQNGGGSPCHG